MGFNDLKLLAEIREALATIKKAMVQINELSTSLDALNNNQLVRWIKTKEEHSTKIITLVTNSCLCDRMKPFSDAESPFESEASYVAALQTHHRVMVGVVKCKQSVDPAVVDALEVNVAEMASMYTPS